MTNDQLTYAGALVVKTCWCGIRHAIPSELARQLVEGSTVYCPLGHSYVTRETRGDRLQRELEQERSRRSATLDLLAHEERSHAATKGHLTRAKRRSAAGLCPCCNRSFEQLRRHMRTQHPDFVAPAEQ